MCSEGGGKEFPVRVHPNNESSLAFQSVERIIDELFQGLRVVAEVTPVQRVSDKAALAAKFEQTFIRTQNPKKATIMTGEVKSRDEQGRGINPNSCSKVIHIGP